MELPNTKHAYFHMAYPGKVITNTQAQSTNNWTKQLFFKCRRDPNFQNLIIVCLLNILLIFMHKQHWST